jgi:hypothetical protein
MKKDIVGDLNKGFAKIDGLLIPGRIRVVLTDPDGPTGDQLPTIRINFEVKEARAKCTELTIIANDDCRSVKSTLLREIDLEALALEAIGTLALQHKTPDSDEVIPAPLPIGRAAARKLAAGVKRLSVVEMMHIGLHYSNPANAKAPTQAVYKGLGYGSRHTAIRRINEAREQGWVLPKGAGAEETARHYEELKRRYEDFKRRGER